MKTVTPPKVRVKNLSFHFKKNTIHADLDETTRELASVRATLAMDNLQETLLQLEKLQKRLYKEGISVQLMAEQVRVALESTKAAMTEINYVRIEGEAAVKKTKRSSHPLDPSP